MVQSSCGGRNGKLNEMIEASALWSIWRLKCVKNLTPDIYSSIITGNWMTYIISFIDY